MIDGNLAMASERVYQGPHDHEPASQSELIEALPRTVAEDDEEDCGQFDEPDYPKYCFGCYAPGTEDCDWCEFADECAG